MWKTVWYTFELYYHLSNVRLYDLFSWWPCLNRTLVNVSRIFELWCTIRYTHMFKIVRFINRQLSRNTSFKFYLKYCDVFWHSVILEENKYSPLVYKHKCSLMWVHWNPWSDRCHKLPILSFTRTIKMYFSVSIKGANVNFAGCL